MRRTLFILTLALTSLTSCDSFNIIHVDRWEGTNPPHALNHKASNKIAEAEVSNAALKSAATSDLQDDAQMRPAAPPPASSSQVDVLCPIYQLPVLPPTPPLPYHDLEHAKTNKQVDAVINKHITDLRSYISTIKGTISDSHQRYLEACEHDYGVAR